MSEEQFLAFLAVALWMLYLDHLIHAFGKWRTERGYRTIRNSYIALMLFVGVTLIAVAAVNRGFPEAIPTIVLSSLRPVLYGMLLLGGVVLAWTWRAEE